MPKPKMPPDPRRRASCTLEPEGVIYARYSSHNQREASIDQQIKWCQDHAARLGIKIRHIYADKAVSGKTDRRPQFQHMMKDAESGQFQFVIAWKSNRMGRNMLQAMVNEARLQDLGIRCLYVEEDFDDTAAGRFALRNMMNVNQFYSENMAEDIMRGLRDNAEKCMVTGSIPFGYKKGPDGRYAIDQPRADLVLDIYKRVADGEAFIDIARDYNARGIKTSTGKQWGRSSFHTIVNNRRYLGIYIYQDIEVPGGVPQIIPEELWDKVQEVLKTKKNAQGKGRRKNDADYLLTGKLRCGHCKSLMVGISGTGKNGLKHYYYKCNKKRLEHACDKKNVNREKIEMAVAQAIKEYVMRPEVIEWLADQVMANHKRLEEQSQLSILKEELVTTQRSIDNLIKAIEMGVITESTQARLKELEVERRELKRQIAEEEKVLIPFDRSDVIAYFYSFRDGDVNDKRYQATLFDSFLSAVYVYDDTLKIVFDFTKGTDTIEVPLNLDLDDLVEAGEMDMFVQTPVASTMKLA